MEILKRLAKVILFIPVCLYQGLLAVFYGIRWIFTGEPFPKAPVEKLLDW